jgi:hypothetical protein
VGEAQVAGVSLIGGVAKTAPQGRFVSGVLVAALQGNTSAACRQGCGAIPWLLVTSTS